MFKEAEVKITDAVRDRTHIKWATLLLNINSFDPHVVILLGDFNAKSKSWSVNDTTTKESTLMESVTSLYGMKQLISTSTHILQDSSNYIDLIFVNQTNLVIDSGIQPSLH